MYQPVSLWNLKLIKNTRSLKFSPKIDPSRAFSKDDKNDQRTVISSQLLQDSFWPLELITPVLFSNIHSARFVTEHRLRSTFNRVEASKSSILYCMLKPQCDCTINGWGHLVIKDTWPSYQVSSSQQKTYNINLFKTVWLLLKSCHQGTQHSPGWCGSVG